MTPEKYVNTIIRGIEADNKKKKEFQRQLLADIRAELEQGKDLALVLKDMGSPEEISEEFNESLSEKDRKQYRRKKAWSIVGLLGVVILLLILWGIRQLPKTISMEDSLFFDSATIEAKMQWTITAINEDDYEALRESATGQMQQVLTEETMMAAKKQVSGDWGSFVGFGTAYLTDISQRGVHYALGQMNVTYENLSVTYTITFDQEGKLAGLYMK